MHSDRSAQLNLPFDGLPPDSDIVIRAPRRRMLLTGKVVHGEGAYSIDCTIRNISVGGAKITLSRHQSLPPNIYLIVVKQVVAHRARVAWLNYPMRGLQFLHTFPLDADLPCELKFLRHLWVGLSARSGFPDGPG